MAGKSGWHVYNAAVQSQSMLRRRLRTGIVQQVLLQDGLHHANLTDKMQARMDLFYGCHLDDLSQGDLRVLETQDWFLVVLEHLARNVLGRALGLRRS